MLRSVAKFCLVATLLTGSMKAHAGTETLHSDLVEFISMFFGLTPNAAALKSSINQGVDNVPGASAIQSGASSDKNHFAKTVTDVNINSDKLDANGRRSFFGAVLAGMKNDTLGGTVGLPGNPQSHELVSIGLRVNSDFDRVILMNFGQHTAVDLAGGFHDGYKGSMPAPILPIPFAGKIVARMFQFPFGHLADGTTPDRLTIPKVINTIKILGPSLIVERESQRNDIGVNRQWLEYLTSQGVDVNSVDSMIEYFTSRPEIQKELLTIEASYNPNYLRKVIDELFERFTVFGFFKKPEDLANRKAIAYQMAEGRPDAAILTFKILETAWSAGELNERVVLEQVFAKARKHAQTLNELVNPIRLDTLPDYVQEAYKKDKVLLAYSPEWIVWSMVEQMGGNLVKIPFSKFDSRYLFQEGEETLRAEEIASITRMQKSVFGENSVKFRYVYNPAVEWRKQLYANLRAASKEMVGRPFLEKVIAWSEAVLNTVIDSEKEIKSLSFKMKLSIFMHNLRYIFKEGFVSPKTAHGTLNYMYDQDRQEMIKAVRKMHRDGLIADQVLENYIAYKQKINDKFNTPNLPVGAIQKSAAALKAGAEYIQSLTAKKTTISAGVRACRSAHSGK